MSKPLVGLPVLAPPERRARPPAGPPLIYWKPVAAAGLFTLAFVTTLALATRPSFSSARPVSVSETAAEATPPAVPEVPVIPIAAEPAFVPVKAFAKPGPGPGALVAALSKSDPLFGAVESLPEPQPPAPVVAQPAAPRKETFGTALAFERNLAEAVQLAQQERRLLFILHISGNFEDSEFT